MDLRLAAEIAFALAALAVVAVLWWELRKKGVTAASLESDVEAEIKGELAKTNTNLSALATRLMDKVEAFEKTPTGAAVAAIDPNLTTAINNVISAHNATTTAVSALQALATPKT